MKRLMISAMHSGSGKTVLTCGLLEAFQRRGITVEALKCGPDYIDPMFHRQVLGLPGRNLDLFLQGEDGVRRTLAKQNAELALLEGAMGFYDGVNGTAAGSAWASAVLSGTPVILAVRPGGASITLAAQLRGLQQFKSPSRLVGVILTDCKPMLYAHLKPILERETGLQVLGYLPHMPEAVFGSRHLGLVTPEEIEDFRQRIGRIAEQLELSCDLTAVLALAADVPLAAPGAEAPARRCRIAVARDEAFCFYYQDNLDALAQAGAELVFFSPLRDVQLPPCDGLYLGGGYPELHLARLEENRSMRQSVKAAIAGVLPTVAECGGFLFLQQTVSDRDGNAYEMAGVLPGSGFPTDRLQRFGYLSLNAAQDSMLFRKGERIPAHEFHYWDTDFCGDSLAAEKPNGRGWRCGFVSDSLYAAFPHLHFNGKLPLAERFAAAAAAYKEKRHDP